MRVLDGALEGLDPSLDDQVTALLDKLRTTVATAQQQAAAAAAAAAAVPGLDLGPSARDLNNAIAADSTLVGRRLGRETGKQGGKWRGGVGSESQLGNEGW